MKIHTHLLLYYSIYSTSLFSLNIFSIIKNIRINIRYFIGFKIVSNFVYLLFGTRKLRKNFQIDNTFLIKECHADINKK